jgi:hypothetical protein
MGSPDDFGTRAFVMGNFGVAAFGEESGQLAAKADHFGQLEAGNGEWGEHMTGFWFDRKLQRPFLKSGRGEMASNT